MTQTLMDKTMKQPLMWILAIAVVIFCQEALGKADKPHPKGYVACKTPVPLKIDGKLTEPAWKTAPWTDDFVDIEGDVKPKPRFRTRAKMLWDDTYLYIGAQLQEPHVWATLTHRDTVIYYDNDFEVFIDPNGDNHEYYEFEMNARNTVWDLFLPKPYKDSGSAVDSWNIEGLKTAVSVQGTLNNPSDIDTGWTVEIAMPWKALALYAHRPAPPHDGDQWRIDFSRVEWLTNIVDGWYQKVAGKPEDNWVWSPQYVVNMHRPETWGYVQFSTKKPGKEAFRPDPAWEVKCILHDVYYAQRAYREHARSWAENLDQLGPPTSVLPAIQHGLSMKTSEGGFVVTMPLKLKGGKTELWHIRQDALLWKD
jgi:hypothetical protein